MRFPPTIHKPYEQPQPKETIVKPPLPSPTSSLHEFWRAYNEALIQQTFAQCKDKSLVGSDQSFIILDDNLVLPLSLYIYATTLRQEGFQKWYRLGVHQDVSDLIKSQATILKNQATIQQPIGTASQTPRKLCWRLLIWFQASHSSVEKVINLLTDLELSDQPVGEPPIDVTLCFVPERKCLLVAMLIEGLRKQTSAEVTNVSEIIGKVIRVKILDTHLRFSPYDEGLYSLNVKHSFKNLNCRGDTRVINDLLYVAEDFIKLSGQQPSQPPPVYSAGPWAQTFTTLLKQRLSNQSQGDETGNAQTDTDLIQARQEEFFKAYIATNEALINPPQTPQNFLLTPSAKGVVHGAHLTRTLHLTFLNAMQATDKPQEVLEWIKQEINFVSSKTTDTKDEIISRIESPTYKIYFPTSRPDPVKLLEDNASVKTLTNFNIKNVIVIDRKFDLISPFVTPFTYEGLVDLTWGINSNHVNIPAEVISEAHSNDIRLRLNDSDRIYLSLRDLPHVELGSALHSLAVEMQALFQTERRADWSVQELQTFMAELKKQCGDHKSLTHHIQVVTFLINKVIKHPVYYSILRVEDDIMSGATAPEDVTKILVGMLQRGYPLHDVVRLGILNSRMNKIDSASTKLLLHSIVRAYGIMEGRLLSELENASVLRLAPPETQIPLTDWDTLNKNFKCVDVDHQKDTNGSKGVKDISFVHSGYAPISVRLIQLLAEESPKALDQMFDKLNVPDMNVTKSELWAPPSGGRIPVGITDAQEMAPVSLVIFIGGVTRSEMAAIRHLNTQHASSR
eukprot:Blabericola_migrator_1__1202@NODE_1308_length_4843_cov_167_627094_g880_i0_p1_GENE_NODE_1308_length_4843_cov_167_627094_g880_i0NODE_1308_length_4843_cov_167_627094_g880_i0_p1_ORF_typecomplete_len792_score186_26Sec1/PF00995_23/7_1e60_NODE_1308_length_4843_cov_167_627094_g880_i01042479